MNLRIFIVIAIALMFVTGVGAVTTAAPAQDQDSIIPNQTELSKKKPEGKPPQTPHDPDNPRS